MCNEDGKSLISQPNPWRYAVVVISDHFYHYDCPEGGLSKCPITFLVGKHFDRKYMIRGEKIHEIQLKHQEDWFINHVHIGSIMLGSGKNYLLISDIYITQTVLFHVTRIILLFVYEKKRSFLLIIFIRTLYVLILYVLYCIIPRIAFSFMRTLLLVFTKIK